VELGLKDRAALVAADGDGDGDGDGGMYRGLL